MNDSHFNKVFWFVVGLATFGAAFTIYLLLRFSGEVAERFADQMMIFWLSTAVNGGIGYLLGSSASTNKINKPPVPGQTTADISATITTETKEEKK